jgi:hypothetical protein
MSKEVIAILSGLLGENGKMKTTYQPVVNPKVPKVLKPVSEEDHKNLMTNWKPVTVQNKVRVPKYIPLHKKPEVRIPNLISRSPFIERDIEMKE